MDMILTIGGILVPTLSAKASSDRLAASFKAEVHRLEAGFGAR